MNLYQLMNILADDTSITTYTKDNHLISAAHIPLLRKIEIMNIKCDGVNELSIKLSITDSEIMKTVEVNESLYNLASLCEKTECNECRFYNIRANHCELRMCPPSDYIKFL